MHLLKTLKKTVALVVAIVFVLSPTPVSFADQAAPVENVNSQNILVQDAETYQSKTVEDFDYDLDGDDTVSQIETAQRDSPLSAVKDDQGMESISADSDEAKEVLKNLGATPDKKSTIPEELACTNSVPRHCTESTAYYANDTYIGKKVTRYTEGDESKTITSISWQAAEKTIEQIAAAIVENDFSGMQVTTDLNEGYTDSGIYYAFSIKTEDEASHSSDMEYYYDETGAPVYSTFRSERIISSLNTNYPSASIYENSDGSFTVEDYNSYYRYSFDHDGNETGSEYMYEYDSSYADQSQEWDDGTGNYGWSDGSGNYENHYADGSSEWGSSDGSYGWNRSDGSYEWYNSNGGYGHGDGIGNYEEYYSDGSSSWGSSDGSYGWNNNDGSYEWYNSDGSYGRGDSVGNYESHYVDGSYSWGNTDGSYGSYNSDGSYEWYSTDGSYGWADAQGNYGEYHSDGSSSWGSSDGSYGWNSSDGSYEWHNADGSYGWGDSIGNYEEYDANGNLVQSSNNETYDGYYDEYYYAYTDIYSFNAENTGSTETNLSFYISGDSSEMVLRVMDPSNNIVYETSVSGSDSYNININGLNPDTSYYAELSFSDLGNANQYLSGTTSLSFQTLPADDEIIPLTEVTDEELDQVKESLSLEETLSVVYKITSEEDISCETSSCFDTTDEYYDESGNFLGSRKYDSRAPENIVWFDLDGNEIHFSVPLEPLNLDERNITLSDGRHMNFDRSTGTAVIKDQNGNATQHSYVILFTVEEEYCSSEGECGTIMADLSEEMQNAEQIGSFTRQRTFEDGATSIARVLVYVNPPQVPATVTDYIADLQNNVGDSFVVNFEPQENNTYLVSISRKPCPEGMNCTSPAPGTFGSLNFVLDADGNRASGSINASYSGVTVSGDDAEILFEAMKICPAGQTCAMQVKSESTIFSDMTAISVSQAEEGMIHLRISDKDYVASRDENKTVVLEKKVPAEVSAYVAVLEKLLGQDFEIKIVPRSDGAWGIYGTDSKIYAMNPTEGLQGFKFILSDQPNMPSSLTFVFYPDPTKSLVNEEEAFILNEAMASLFNNPYEKDSADYLARNISNMAAVQIISARRHAVEFHIPKHKASYAAYRDTDGNVVVKKQLPAPIENYIAELRNNVGRSFIVSAEQQEDETFLVSISRKPCPEGMSCTSPAPGTFGSLSFILNADGVRLLDSMTASYSGISVSGKTAEVLFEAMGVCPQGQNCNMRALTETETLAELTEVSLKKSEETMVYFSRVDSDYKAYRDENGNVLVEIDWPKREVSDEDNLLLNAIFGKQAAYVIRQDPPPFSNDFPTTYEYYSSDNMLIGKKVSGGLAPIDFWRNPDNSNVEFETSIIFSGIAKGVFGEMPAYQLLRITPNCSGAEICPDVEPTHTYYFFNESFGIMGSYTEELGSWADKSDRQLAQQLPLDDADKAAVAILGGNPVWKIESKDKFLVTFFEANGELSGTKTVLKPDENTTVTTWRSAQGKTEQIETITTNENGTIETVIQDAFNRIIKQTKEFQDGSKKTWDYFYETEQARDWNGAVSHEYNADETLFRITTVQRNEAMSITSVSNASGELIEEIYIQLSSGALIMVDFPNEDEVILDGEVYRIELIDRKVKLRSIKEELEELRTELLERIKDRQAENDLAKQRAQQIISDFESELEELAANLETMLDQLREMLLRDDIKPSNREAIGQILEDADDYLHDSLADQKEKYLVFLNKAVEVELAAQEDLARRLLEYQDEVSETASLAQLRELEERFPEIEMPSVEPVAEPSDPREFLRNMARYAQQAADQTNQGKIQLGMQIFNAQKTIETALKSLMGMPPVINEDDLPEWDALFSKAAEDVRAALETLHGWMHGQQYFYYHPMDPRLPSTQHFPAPESVQGLEDEAMTSLKNFYENLMQRPVESTNFRGNLGENMRLPVSELIDVLLEEMEALGFDRWSAPEKYLHLKGLTSNDVGSFHPEDGMFFSSLFTEAVVDMPIGPSLKDLRDMVIRFVSRPDNADIFAAEGSIHLETFRMLILGREAVSQQEADEVKEMLNLKNNAVVASKRVVEAAFNCGFESCEATREVTTEYFSDKDHVLEYLGQKIEMFDGDVLVSVKWIDADGNINPGEPKIAYADEIAEYLGVAVSDIIKVDSKNRPFSTCYGPGCATWSKYLDVTIKVNGEEKHFAGFAVGGSWGNEKVMIANLNAPDQSPNKTNEIIRTLFLLETDPLVTGELLEKISEHIGVLPNHLTEIETSLFPDQENCEGTNCPIWQLKTTVKTGEPEKLFIGVITKVFIDPQGNNPLEEYKIELIEMPELVYLPEDAIKLTTVEQDLAINALGLNPEEASSLYKTVSPITVNCVTTPCPSNRATETLYTKDGVRIGYKEISGNHITFKNAGEVVMQSLELVTNPEELNVVKQILASRTPEYRNSFWKMWSEVRGQAIYIANYSSDDRDKDERNKNKKWWISLV